MDEKKAYQADELCLSPWKDGIDSAKIDSFIEDYKHEMTAKLGLKKGIMDCVLLQPQIQDDRICPVLHSKAMRYSEKPEP